MQPEIPDTPGAVQAVNQAAPAPAGDAIGGISGGSSWSGRFDEPVSELVKRYTASVDFDKRLAEYDIQGSLAHARMLAG